MHEEPIFSTMRHTAMAKAKMRTGAALAGIGHGPVQALPPRAHARAAHDDAA